jgi:hypothetical protein
MKLKKIQLQKKNKKTESIRLTRKIRDLSHETGTIL